MNNIKTIKNYTEFIRNKLGLNFPINMFTVLDSLNLSYKKDKTINIDVILKNNIFIYNPQYNIAHLNFALAREFGRFLLIKGNNLNENFIINEFAVQFLVPDDYLYNTNISIKELAKKFNIQYSVINRRLNILYKRLNFYG